MGHFERLDVLWNPKYSSLNPFSSKDSIILEVHLRGLSHSIMLVIFYGTYEDREVFWRLLYYSGLMYEVFLILIRDIKFTTSSSEVWGENYRPDPFSPFISHLIHNSNLIDVYPFPIVVTWTNGREVDQWIFGWLDLCLMVDSLDFVLSRYRSWIGPEVISYHFPIFIQLDFNISLSRYPFTFNHSWIKEESFKYLI